MLVKLSDYVADRLAEAGVRNVFGISGGASLHLLHSINDHPALQIFCPHHEQAAAMAADGCARVSKKIGVTVATSGPGATNLITGICGAFYDSVPMLCLTGQVSSFRNVGSTGVRQIGFQETPIVDLCRPVTKYAVKLQDPQNIGLELDKCLFLATDGRPGPTLLDIPDNYQREMIDTKSLKRWRSPTQETSDFLLAQVDRLNNQVEEALKLLSLAKRPVVIAGAGLHLGNCEKEFHEFLKRYAVPVVMTWGAADILPADHRSYVGTFGTHGQRHANFAIQNADFVLSLGSRLDTKSTGTPVNSFAREAKRVMVDVDEKEIKKFEHFDLSLHLGIHCNLKQFFILAGSYDQKVKRNLRWANKILSWKSEFDAFDNTSRSVSTGLAPYAIVKELFEIAPKKTQFFLDTGATLAWSMQSFLPDSGKRVFHDFNNTAMGWALPACFGAWTIDKGKPYFCLSGDGSLMMNIQELATTQFHKMPLKLFVINNGGYAMIKQTQDQWLGSEYIASNKGKDLGFPNFEKLADSFGMKYLPVNTVDELRKNEEELTNNTDACFIEITVPPDARVIPQVKFGRPNEDMEPLLPREIFKRNMIIETLVPAKAH